MTETMLYSPSAGGFFIREIHGAAVPSDVVQVQAEEYQALLAGQQAGRRIVAVDGRPVLVDPEPDPAVLARVVRGRRDYLLRAADDLMQRHRNQVEYALPTTLTHEEVAAVAAYAVALRDVPSQVGFPSNVIWPPSPAGIDTN